MTSIAFLPVEPTEAEKLEHFKEAAAGFVTNRRWFGGGRDTTLFARADGPESANTIVAALYVCGVAAEIGTRNDGGLAVSLRNDNAGPLLKLLDSNRLRALGGAKSR